MKEIGTIYKSADSQYSREKVANLLYRSVQKQTSIVTVKDAFCARAYRSGTGVALIIMALHELTAGNAILLYSNTLLGDIGGPITPRMGTYIIGVVNFIASSISTWSARYFSRRFLFIGGHLLMGLCHLMIAFFIGIGKGAYAFISILAF